MTRPLIFLTNDDGITSPGLWAAARALHGLGELLVVAPSTQQTAMGRSYRGDREARLEPFAMNLGGAPVRAYSLKASPASLVRHGLQVFCQERVPDLLVSGINYGENVGVTIAASGTIGAAMEGAAHGIRALAVAKQTHPDSHYHHGEEDWGAAEHFTRYFAERMLKAELPPDVDFVKVDVPEEAHANTPWRLTRLTRQPYFVSLLKQPRLESRIGESVLEIHVNPQTLEKDSDVHALVMDKVVSVTPLSLDTTSRANFDDILLALG
jgi:5'-nucleotidase